MAPTSIVRGHQFINRWPSGDLGRLLVMAPASAHGHSSYIFGFFGFFGTVTWFHNCHFGSFVVFWDSHMVSLL